MLRMAERCGVDRQAFLDHYFGRELDPRSVSRVKRLAAKGWSKFADRYGDEVTGVRKAVPDNPAASALPIRHLPRIAKPAHPPHNQPRPTHTPTAHHPPPPPPT